MTAKGGAKLFCVVAHRSRFEHFHFLKLILLGWIALIPVAPIMAMTTDYVTVQNGLWRDSATWTSSGGGGGYPTTGDTARILHQVTVQH